MIKIRKKGIVKKTLVLLFATAMTLASCKKMEQKKEFNLLDLQKVSVLNTLNCTFKNVLTYEVPNEIPILGIPMPKEKYFLEYNATVDIGIDMKEIEFEKETNTIKIPKAKVTGKANYDIDSMKSYGYKKLVGSGLDINIVQVKLSESLDDLKSKIEENYSIMDKAQSLALSQIEALVDNVYTVAGRKPSFNYVLK
jgi:hypothetical protein